MLRNDFAFDTVDSVFEPVNDDLIVHIKDRIERHLPAFISPANFILSENEQVAYRMSEIINGFGKGTKYLTFFCNSHLEAVHGAIKLVRHFVRTQDQMYNGDLLHLDPDDYYVNAFNPLQAAEDGALLPGIYRIKDVGRTIDELERRRMKILLLSLTHWPDETYLPLIEYARDRGIVFVLDVSRIKAIDSGLTGSIPLKLFDIVCWGESLTDFQLPFGAFSSKEKLYRVWNNMNECFTHSSTFSGNGTVLSYVKRVLDRLFPVFTTAPGYRKQNERIQQSGVHSRFRRHINTYCPIRLLASANLSLNIVKARGIYLYEKGVETAKIDLAGSGGCNALGHNMPELVAEVLVSHHHDTDYFKLLEQRLFELTGLEKIFQGVSGASAVEIGITLALLSNRRKKKILILDGNFSGKTMVALNATSGDHSCFAPLYQNVCIYNPYENPDHTKLNQILVSGEIGLVWLEIIQGRSLRPVPDAVISAINLNKKKGGYLIGVDDVLCGVYRSGSITSFAQDRLVADIVTFSKAFSGMIVPTSVTLVSSDVYKNAYEESEATVLRLEKIYKNQLSAHVALYVLDELTARDVANNVRDLSIYLDEQLNRIAKGTKYLLNVYLHGFHVKYTLDLSVFPFNYLGQDRSNAVIAYLFYTRGGLLTFLNRLLPPLTMTRGEADQIISGLRKVFSCSSWYLLMVAIRLGIVKQYYVLLNKIRDIAAFRNSD